MKVADYSDQVTVDQLDAALRAGGFEAVLHYVAGTPGWALRIEDPAVVAGIRAKGWPQMGIDIPFSPADVDGAATAARAAQVYGCAAGFRLWLDIEPSRWELDKPGWIAAADRWCDDVRAAGFSPGVYGVDETVAACANHADAIWRAKPDECDPAGPGLADAFFAGRRMIQCGSGAWGGVEFDVNYSQFPIGGGAEVGNPLVGLGGTDPNVQRLLENANDIDWMLSTGQRHGLGFDVNGVITDVPEPTWGFWLGDQFAELQKAIVALNQPAVDPSAVATGVAAALAANTTFLDALSTAVAHKIGGALDKA